MTVVCHRGPAWRRTGDVMPGDGAGVAGAFVEDAAAAGCNPAPGADPSETMASSAAEASRLMR